MFFNGWAACRAVWDEEHCVEQLAELRWPGGFVCDGCGVRQAWRLKSRLPVYEYATCHRQWTMAHKLRHGLSEDS